MKKIFLGNKRVRCVKFFVFLRQRFIHYIIKKEHEHDNL